MIMIRRSRKPDMKDNIYDFIEKHGRLVSSTVLVKAFLKSSYDNEALATKIISSIIGYDDRFEYIECAGWSISENKARSILINKQKFVTFAANIHETGKQKGRICEASFIQIVDGKEEASWHISPPSLDSNKHPGTRSGRHHSIRADELPGIKIRDAHKILKFTENAIILFFEPLSAFRQLQIEVGNKTGIPLGNEFLSLKKVLSNLYGLKRNASIEDAAKSLGISIVTGSSAQIKAKASTEIFLTLLDHLLESGIKYFDEFKALEEKKGEKVDFSLFYFNESFLLSLPETPGIYKFLNDSGKPIYIGKAKNLKRRVSSYFLCFSKTPAKIRSIYESLKKIEYEETGSDLEAILRESEMIQSLEPPLNKQFAVHERVATYGKRENLILILPGTTEKEAVLYFIKDGKLIKKIKIRKGKKKFPEAKFQAIKNLLKSEYFFEDKDSKNVIKTEKESRKRQRDDDIELISSYLRENKDKVNWFDPTDYKTADEVIKIIKSYLKETLLEGYRIIKV